MDPDPSPVRVVLITHPVEDAEAFAKRLVEARLAACVNLHEVRSVYRWEARLESTAEVQLVLKTSLEKLEALEEFLEREHPYDVPECVALGVERVEAKYAAWLRGSL